MTQDELWAEYKRAEKTKAQIIAQALRRYANEDPDPVARKDEVRQADQYDAYVASL